MNNLSEILSEAEHERLVEEAVLGAMLLERPLFKQYKHYLSPDIWCVNAHALIYQAMAELTDAGKDIDLITIVQQIKKNGQLKETGGYAYLADLTNRVTNTANIETHCLILNERKLAVAIENANNEANKALKDGADPLEVAAKHKEALSKATDFDHLRTGLDMKSALFDYLNQEKAQKVHLPKLWENVLGEVNLTDFIIFAGRPKHGKTYTVIDMVKHLSEMNGHVLFFCLEMPEKQMAGRFYENYLAQLGGVGNEDKAAAMAEKLKIHFITGKVTLDRVERTIINMKAKYDVKAVVIDHIGLLRVKGSRYEATTEASNTLRVLALEYKVLMIAISQMNRTAADNIKVDDEGNVSLPKSHEMRDSGALEQDATHIVICYNHSVYEGNVDESFKVYGKTFETHNTMILNRAIARVGRPAVIGVHLNYATGFMAELTPDEYGCYRYRPPMFQPSPQALPEPAFRASRNPAEDKF